MKDGLIRDLIKFFDKGGIALPANFYARLKISFGASHAEKAASFEFGFGAKDFRVGMEANFGAAAIINRAKVFDFPFGFTFGKFHFI